MSKRRASLVFRQEIAICFKQAIRKHGLSNKQAAEILGVKRQTLWLYLTAKSAPGTEVLKRASKHWKLTLGDGYILTAGAFGPDSGPRLQAKQLDLYKALDRVKP